MCAIGDALEVRLLGNEARKQKEARSAGVAIDSPAECALDVITLERRVGDDDVMLWRGRGVGGNIVEVDTAAESRKEMREKKIMAKTRVIM